MGFGFRVSVFEFRILGPGFQISDFEFRISSFEFRVSGFEGQILSFGFRVSGLGFRVSGLGFRVPGFWFRVSSFRFRASGFGLRVSDFEFRVTGFGFPVPGLEFRVWGFWFRISNSDFQLQVLGYGFRVSSFRFIVLGLRVSNLEFWNSGFGVSGWTCFETKARLLPSAPAAASFTSSLICTRMSTPPQNRQLIVYYCSFKHGVHGFAGVLTFRNQGCTGETESFYCLYLKSATLGDTSRSSGANSSIYRMRGSCRAPPQPPLHLFAHLRKQNTVFPLHNVLIKWLYKVNFPTKSSTDRLLSLIKTIC